MISKKFSSLILLILSLSLLVTSCVTTTESILQETEVKGAPVRHPIRITENREAGNFILRGNISFNNNNLLETQSSKTLMVNEQGVFQVDEVPGSNIFLSRKM